MRENKFRAWIKRKNELMYLKGFRYSGNEKIKITFTDEDCDDCTYKFLNKDVILEQFTGLHDKNGVEIYEGDIIELEDRFVAAKWHDYLYKYDCEFLEHKEDSDKNFIFKGIDFNKLRNYEVIGNIHEKES